MTKVLRFRDIIQALQSAQQLVDHKNCNDESCVTFEQFSTQWQKTPANGCLLLYKGVSFDPHEKITAILQQQPSLLIVESAQDLAQTSQAYIQVRSGRAAWAIIMNAFYDDPSSKIKFVGITGTNGKTSTVWFIKELLEKLGKRVTTIGTLGAYIGEKREPTEHTTPDPDVLYKLFAKAVSEKCDYVVMEVSSHAIAQKKLEPVRFTVCALTSFSQDHLDLHGTMEEYFSCKMRLFTELSQDHALKLIHDSVREKITIATQFYGPKTNLNILQKSIQETRFSVSLGKDQQEFRTPIIGTYFCENLALAILICRHLTQLWPAKEALALIRPVPGRLEIVKAERPHPHLFVDYAHTPDAIYKTCEELKDLSSEHLTVVFGCGGNRDRGKRPLMYQAAINFADTVIVTSDNPRYEDPEMIMDDILQNATKENLAKTRRISDRREAIQEATVCTPINGVILIAGKGHEDYQIIKDKKWSFDDREIARDILKSYTPS